METKENNVELIGYTLTKPIIVSFPNEAKLARLKIRLENSEEFNILLVNQDAGLIEKDLAIGTKIATKGVLINHTYINRQKEKKQDIDILTREFQILARSEEIPQE